MSLLRAAAPCRPACLAIALLAASSLPLAAQQAEQSFITGVCTHLAQNAPDPDGTLALAAAAGIGSIRDEVYWSGIEHDPGKFEMPERWDHYVDVASRAGVAPLLILDYGNPLYDRGDKPRSDAAIAAFARYADFVARHFHGKVRRYEVWNEWSNGIGGTTPGSVDDYARLLKPVHAALKAADPAIEVLADAIVMGNGRDSDFEKMAKLELLRFADGVTVHPYFYNHGPKKTPEAWAEWVGETERSLRRYNDGAAVPLYVTEIGWPTYAGRDGVTLGRSAAYAARLLLLARTMPFLHGLWWYDFRNDGGAAGAVEQNFGLLWPDLTPKPAYHSLAGVTSALDGATLIDRRATASDDDWILRFRDRQGREFWAVWTARENTVTRFNLATLAEKPEPLLVQEPGTRPVGRTWLPAPHGVWRLDVTAGEMPVFLWGALADTTVVGAAHQDFPGDLR